MSLDCGIKAARVTMVAMAVSLVVSSAVRAAGPVRFQSGDRTVPLLELYSSEGCSSCPPADSWLNGLRKDPRLWRDMVPIAFHVDVWDDQGWRDPYASKKYSVRQRLYSDAWGGGRVYTPGFVLNGLEWRGWFDGKDLPPRPATQAGNLIVAAVDDGSWVATFDPADPAPADWKIHVALLGFDLTSAVAGGENRGRSLEHDFVCLGLADQPLSVTGGRYSATVRVFPDLVGAPEAGAVAAWVTRGDGPPVQATGGFIPPASAPTEDTAPAAP